MVQLVIRKDWGSVRSLSTLGPEGRLLQLGPLNTVAMGFPSLDLVEKHQEQKKRNQKKKRYCGLFNNITRYFGLNSL